MSGKLTWYLQRLQRMGPAEVAFRLREQALRWSDRRRDFGWESFAPFDGEVRGLPCLRLASASDTHLAAARKVRDRLRTGNVGWLGQDWPPLGDDWLRMLWTLDPVSDTHWPGAGARAGYRDKAHRGDVKFVWEPNRLQFLQSLALLAAHGDADAGQLGWDIIAGWMDANPPYGGVNWSSGIEAASRVVSVLVFVTGQRAPLDAKRDTMVRRFLAAHARLLSRYPSLHSSANNHRVSELAALLLVSLCAPGLTLGAHTTSSILAELETEVAKQFHPDGVGAEQSPTYAAYSIEWFTLAAVVAEANGGAVSATYRDRLGKAVEHLHWLLDDAGRAPRIGDDDEGRVLALDLEPEPRYPASVAALTARWLGIAEPAHTLRDPALRDLIGESTTAAVQPTGSRTFAPGGYTIVRTPTARGQSVLTIDHGPLGFLSIAAHGHADALSLLLSWGDEPVLVDAGTYLYHAGGTHRDELRGTGIHNTLALEGQNQSRIVGPFAWADHARTELVSQTETGLVARCLGWQRRFGVIHERRLDWQGQEFHVEDHLIGRTAAPLSWRSGLSLVPGSRLALNGETATVRTPGGRALVLRSAGIPWDRTTSIYSSAFNTLQEIDRLELGGRSTPGRVAAFTISLES
jgi:hypothetical protein